MTATRNDDRQTYTVTEVAKILGIGRNTAYEACNSGEIPTLRLGGRILIPRAAIDDLLGRGPSDG